VSRVEVLRAQLNRLIDIQTGLVVITCVQSYQERMSKAELAATRKTLRAVRRMLNETGDALNDAHKAEVKSD
jgi:hypothetical protein